MSNAGKKKARYTRAKKQVGAFIIRMRLFIESHIKRQNGLVSCQIGQPKKSPHGYGQMVIKIVLICYI